MSVFVHVKVEVEQGRPNLRFDGFTRQRTLDRLTYIALVRFFQFQLHSEGGEYKQQLEGSGGQ